MLLLLDERYPQCNACAKTIIFTLPPPSCIPGAPPTTAAFTLNQEPTREALGIRINASITISNITYLYIFANSLNRLHQTIHVRTNNTTRFL